jgi:hypothetical protein
MHQAAATTHGQYLWQGVVMLRTGDEPSLCTQGIEAEAQRQMPVVDATVDRVGEARAGVRDTARQTFNYRTRR